MKSKESYFRIAGISSKKSNDKVGFEHFSLQRNPHCTPSIVTRTRLCCYITFWCDIARDWKAIYVCEEKAGFAGLICQKVSVQHFGNSIQSRGWLKGSFSQHKTTSKRVIEPEWPLPGSTAGKYLPEVSRTKFNCRISWHFAAISNFSWFIVKTGTF